MNTDLALAAQCEAEGDLFITNETYFDLYRSPMYRKLRETFLEQAMAGNEDALLLVVWRSYNAGLVSPERFVPETKQVREERHLQQHLLKSARK